MLGKTNAVSGKQKYGAYNIEEVEVDGGVVLEITDADEKPVDKLQLWIDETDSCERMFNYYSGGNEVMAEMLQGLDTSNVTDMRFMFSYCNKLTTLDLNHFDTSSVTNMNSMFYQSSKLTSLGLINFDTSNATDMSAMFFNCGSLTSLDLSNFGTSNVTNMGAMFQSCTNLTSLNLSSFNTSNVTNMSSMFFNCSKLTSLNLSNSNTSKVTDMSWMFQNCTNLTSLNLNFNVSNVKNMTYMFYGCSNLPTIQGTLDLYSATNVGSMFSYTRALTGVTLKNIRISLQIGSGTTWGHLWELSYLVNAVKELWDLSASTQQTLTIGTANLEKIANVYVKLVDVIDEMIAEDPYSANKLPCVECESTDEGAMTLTAYAGLKNWVLA